MSRVGKLPVPVPSGVSVTLEDGRCVVKGPKGLLEHDVHPEVRVSLDDGQVVVTRPSDAPAHRSLGYALVRLGEVAEAKKELSRYVELEPKAKDAAEVKSIVAGLP